MRATVLVVDDDEAVRTTLARLLETEGLDVVEEADGARAVEAVTRIGADLVLLDVVMPGLDGFEVCRRLKADPRTRLVPVVMLTALTAVADRVTGIEAGADDFLTKPCDRTELVARVRSALRVKSYTDQLEQAEAVVLALARSIEGKDPYTQGHCERLAAYASELGRRLGLPKDEITALHIAGTLHDVGKIAVPDAVLLKPGPLTQDERAVIQDHPVTGEHICQPIKSFAPVLPIIRHHHERLDGSGYPDGLRGDAIPMTARILQVVDVYDALTSDRPYRTARSPAEALGILEAEAAKGWWDAQIVGELGCIVLTPEDADFRSERTPGPDPPVESTP